MTPEELWRTKSDEQLQAAASRLDDYTEQARTAITAEIHRRHTFGASAQPVTASPPSPTVEDASVPPPGGGGIVRRLWRGGYSLPVTYWGWGLCGGLVAAVIVAVAEAVAHPLVALVLAVVSLGYWVLVCVAIWRSADRFDGSPVWATLAKVAVSAGVARMGVMLLFG